MLYLIGECWRVVHTMSRKLSRSERMLRESDYILFFQLFWHFIRLMFSISHSILISIPFPLVRACPPVRPFFLLIFSFKYPFLLLFQLHEEKTEINNLIKTTYFFYSYIYHEYVCCLVVIELNEPSVSLVIHYLVFSIFLPCLPNKKNKKKKRKKTRTRKWTRSEGTN